MANATYPTYKKVAISPGLDLVSGSTLKACLVSTTSGTTNYTYSATDQFFSAVAAGAIVAAGVALTGKAVSVSGTSGILTASSVVWPSVAQNGSQTGQAVIIYNDTGTAGTSQLIEFLDTQTGLPITPNGANITMNFSSNVITFA